MKLQDILSAFSSAVRNPQAIPKGLSTATAKNFSAYRRNHLYALLEVLQRRYPAVEKFLGKDNFKFFAREYIYSHPSDDPNIDNYGSQLAEFLQTRKELHSYAYLADLAKIDSLFYQAQGQCQVAAGVLTVWQAIINDANTTGLEVSPDEQCLVVCEQSAKEIYLRETALAQ